MDSGDDSPDFALEWAVKDMVLALDAAPGRSLDVLAALRDRWQRLVHRAWVSWTSARPGTACDPAVPPRHADAVAVRGARSRTGCLPWSV